MEYEKQVDRHLKVKTLMHLITGLAAETGEVSGVVQKAEYKRQDLNLQEFKIELGDVLFYVTALINYFGWTVEEVQIENIEKLDRRHGK